MSSIRLFSGFLAISIVASVFQAAWIISLAVFLAERFPLLSGGAIASGAIAFSYVTSILARGNARRGLTWGLQIIALGMAALSKGIWWGCLIVAAGLGLVRASQLSLVAGLSTLEPSRAFSLYNAAINLAYLMGGIAAYGISSRLGWNGLWLVSAIVSGIASLASLFINPVPRSETNRTPAKWQPLAVVALLVVVTTYFFVAAQYQTVLAILVEQECPRIRSGGLGAAHGLGVLVFSLLQSAVRGNKGNARALAVGLLFVAGSFVLLAATARLDSLQVFVSVGLVSVGETVVGANMQALGSRLAGLGRSAYWLAALVGYLLSGAASLVWQPALRQAYLLTIAGLCLLSGAVALLGLKRDR
jgi:hypothetical protein